MAKLRIGLNRRSWLGVVAGTAGAAGFIGNGSAQSKPPARSAPANPVAETAAGRVRGFGSRGVQVFLGIPYGASTTGQNRFMPPVKPEPWAGVRNCLSYGHSCPGAGAGVIENDHNARSADEDAFLLYRTGGWYRGEDCLRLNVFTPATNGKRAVMVFMHGGGWTGGSGNDLLCYDGQNLARRHNMVVVTHNHRLNLFGYLNLAEIGGERYASSGNVGMLDIVAVLQWVRDNIANFGGDPSNVLVYGQSGGGWKISHLMAMPAAKGLFHSAAIQSGAMLRSGSAESATGLAAAVLNELDIPKSNLDKIHSLPTSALCQVQAAAQRRISAGGPARGGPGGWGPIVDGAIFPAHPFEPAAPAVSANVPMLIGTCLNESVHGCDNPERDTLTNAELMKRISARYKDKAEDIVAAYRREYPKDSPFGLWAAISAAEMRQTAITQAERKAAQGGAPAYMYLYAWRTPALGGKPGTYHASELTFVFDNAELCTHYSAGAPSASVLSSNMGEAWASLARTGKPGHSGLPEWPAYTQKNRSTMVFDTPCSIRNAPEEEGLKLIRQAG